MARYLCNGCDDDWSDDVDGLCQSCRDDQEELECRVAIQKLDAEEYEQFMAEHYNSAFHTLRKLAS